MDLPIKYKRGNAFINVDTGQTVWLWRIQSQLTYVVSDSPDMEAVYLCSAHSLKPVKKASTGLVSKPKAETTETKSSKATLNDFYIKIALKMPYDCEECGKKLLAYNQFAKRCCCCHILPKAQFPSIATHEANIIFMGSTLLGGCNHHDCWDNMGAEHRSKMNIYPTVLKRFEILKPLLTDRELIKAYTYLGLTWI